MKNDTTMTLETTARQAEYVKKQQEQPNGMGLVFADAFLRGMRDIGYKSPAWAFCEMIDNAVQAQATVVELVFGDLVSERSGAQPQQLALVDNGVGMIPDMIGYSVRWGGTDREDDRNGFGRYGYGLPSSVVSMARKYSVYSKTAAGEWHRVTVDIEALATVANDLEAINERLRPVPAAPPTWVGDAAAHVGPLAGAKSGTVVVLEDLDRLREQSGWKAARAMKPKFMQQFGLVYRAWLSELRLFVDGDPVEAIDPLFLMEHGRYYEETDVMAVAVEARSFTVRSRRGEEGKVTIRSSYLPPNFQLADPAAFGAKGAKTNKRHAVMKAYNGLHVCRDGREIECVSPPSEWTRFQNYDRNIRIELDFDPELDEFFGITTAKQQITIDDDMWDRLRNNGKLLDLITDLRKRFKKDLRDLKARAADKPAAEERPSEVAMRASEKFKVKRRQLSERQQQEAQEKLEREVARVAAAKGRDPEEVRAELEQAAASRPFQVRFSAVEEGPFYRPERFGEQKRLFINTGHPFFEKVFDVVPEARAALEVLLLVLAEGELEAEDEFETFYKMARKAWSERLQHALEHLRPDETVFDAANAAAALTEVELDTVGDGA